MLIAAATFGLLMTLPANFSYPAFGALLFFNGIGFGLFAAPNTTGIMNAVPARLRGSASGMRATFMNSGVLLSIGLFFSLMIAGLASALPHTMSAGLTAQGIPAPVATRVASLPPVGSLFAAFLGYNPMKTLLGRAQRPAGGEGELHHGQDVLPPAHLGTFRPRSPHRVLRVGGPDARRSRRLVDAGDQVRPRGKGRARDRRA
ncbi:MAG TPA: hypothetical protein VET24_02955 [Actinomycetota bacterium]|nr:hypothetical protein [Actinomycetota bacterium]